MAVEDCDDETASVSKAEVTQFLRQTLADLLRTKSGSVLRGWRAELDPEFTQQVCRKDFLRVASNLALEDTLQLPSTVAAEVLLQSDGGDFLSLVELVPELAVLVCRFRRHVESFGSAKNYFNALLQRSCKDCINFQEFVAACQRHGFESSEQELTELFCLCDLDQKDQIQLGDVMFLEPDQGVKEQEFLRIHLLKMGQKGHRQAFMAEVYVAEQGRNLSNRHRLAARPWQAKDFEALPKVICHRNHSWMRGKMNKKVEAREAFLQYIRRVYGCEVRGWRRGLDPDSTFQLSLSSLKKWFRNESHLRDTIELPTLWSSLDRDNSGSIGLEELAPQQADTLAKFRQWVVDKFGTCADVWDHPVAKQAFSDPQREGLWKSGTKLLIGTLAKILKDLDCPFMLESTAKAHLLSSLDYFGCGFISRSDLEWLDAWDPPEWLNSLSNHSAWEEIRALILARFEHPLAAWRGLLDKDDSNSVSWREFKDACKKVGFRGDIGGAWRALDEDLSGAITLREFDEPSAKILESFKVWGEANFGSIELLFKSIDEDGSGSLTYPELRRACKQGKWRGDVHLLFNALDTDQVREGGKRTVDLDELLFLDAWEPADDDPISEPGSPTSPWSASRPITSASIASLSGASQTLGLPSASSRRPTTGIKGSSLSSALVRSGASKSEPFPRTLPSTCANMARPNSMSSKPPRSSMGKRQDFGFRHAGVVLPSADSQPDIPLMRALEMGSSQLAKSSPDLPRPRTGAESRSGVFPRPQLRGGEPLGPLSPGSGAKSNLDQNVGKRKGLEKRLQQASSSPMLPTLSKAIC